jgi:hypothetical protein
MRTSLCSLSPPHVKIVPLLDAYRLLFAVTMAYLELELFLIMFVSGVSFILKY